MRPIRLSVGAAGSSVWCPLDSRSSPFEVGLGFVPASGATLTAKVQHTFDSPYRTHAVSVSRSGVTATVVDTGLDGLGHGLSVGDSVFIEKSGSSTLDGTFDVASVIDANTYTYTVANSGPTTDQGQTDAIGFRVFDHATMAGMTTRTDGNYSFSVSAIRLNVTAYTSGRADLWVTQGSGP